MIFKCEADTKNLIIEPVKFREPSYLQVIDGSASLALKINFDQFITSNLLCPVIS